MVELLELSTRRKRVFKHVVEEYVVNATPVASALLTSKYLSDVSPATVRNDLSCLEELGLLYQPHTSAGRVPSDLGYRYYVDHLMPNLGPSPSEQRTIRHQFHQVEGDAGQWARLSSSVLAQMVQGAAVVSAPLPPRASLRRLELVYLQEDVLLATLITQSGGVRQELLHVGQLIDPNSLARLSNSLSERLAGKTAGQVRQAGRRSDGLEARCIDSAARLLQQSDEQQLGALSLRGLSYILCQPEFAHSQKMRPVLEVLEQGAALTGLLATAMRRSGVQIIIGQEHSLQQMRETSFILSRYGFAEEVVGALGVIGPTRMAYWRVVPAVRFMTELMGLLLQEYYRRPPTSKAWAKHARGLT